MGSRTFLDTNVLLYLFDGGDPARRAAAREAYGGLAPEEVVLSTQVLQEFYWNATRKLKPPVARDVAARVVEDLAAHEVVGADVDLILRGAAREAEDGVPFWDAMIVEAALAAGCERLLTEDLQHGRKFGRLVVENPFRRER